MLTHSHTTISTYIQANIPKGTTVCHTQGTAKKHWFISWIPFWTKLFNKKLQYLEKPSYYDTYQHRHCSVTCVNLLKSFSLVIQLTSIIGCCDEDWLSDLHIWPSRQRFVHNRIPFIQHPQELTWPILRNILDYQKLHWPKFFTVNLLLPLSKNVLWYAFHAFR